MAALKGGGAATNEKISLDVRSDSFPTLMSASTLNEDQRAYFQSIFEKYDRDANGRIDLLELEKMIREENSEVSHKIVKKLMKYSNKDNDGKIDVDEFVDMVLDKNFRQLFGDYAKSYVDFLVPKDKRHAFKPVGRRAVRAHTDGHTTGEGPYEEGMSCCPPPICLVLVSIFELICYILNEHLPEKNDGNNDVSLGPVADLFVYSPVARQECWRFLTYMFVHIGWMHITMNLICQVFLGVALEVRNRWWRVLTVYTAGVLAGSLITSIFDPTVYLAGASGGVYAILTAHISNIILNWSEMTYPAIQLFVFLLMIIADVASSIHTRYFAKDETPIGYSAHFGGALAGFLVGIWVLTNVQPTRKENYLWWAALVVYILLTGTAIVLNIFWKGHFFPTQ